ncbi:Cbp4p KNAG_0H02670 [Huiozyma naganishii CBS 8797]|uniref:Cytochrome b mRNA-processing protein 4 n=1 Tax=Huiozyma naganishii (strain ATCC MYA-139 / BCRC 22969 / CBS 8797 / KCTC 17520 / NBRC 10181 / NCYC 3082 / Yp74L-3) TaxID=1071383 RepID=J7S1V9_HUIN7|nr:hypothetical protein KNAG_0H02670 [Kazachstania naganishii CBS 8797]CCK71682.1 hypothetical protein KNAG_0H02670 [Kazachstania naganishii CBS 8797]
MEGPVWRRWLRVYVWGGAIIGSGVLLFKYSTPSDEKLIESFSPEVRRRYEEGRQLRQEEQRQLMKIVRETANSSDPIWKTGPIQSPFERRNNNNNTAGSQDIFDEFHRRQGEDDKRGDLERMQNSLLEIRRQNAADQPKKHWWKPW